MLRIRIWLRGSQNVIVVAEFSSWHPTPPAATRVQHLVCWKHQAFATVSRCDSPGMWWSASCHPELATGAAAGRLARG
jgi:hypothetical protein